MTKQRYKIINSAIDYKNPYFQVRHEELIKENGDKANFYIVATGPSVMMAALTDNNELLFIKQFRYTTKIESLELPAGGNDGEDPLVAAKRELQEETGYTAANWQCIGRVQSAKGISDQYTDIFIATDLRHTNRNEMNEEGISRVLKIPLYTIDDLVRTQAITDMQTIGALYMVKIHLLAQNAQQNLN